MTVIYLTFGENFAPASVTLMADGMMFKELLELTQTEETFFVFFFALAFFDFKAARGNASKR